MVGIVILNYNNAQQTLDCVSSLRRHCTGGNWRLCIVDNASPDARQWEILQENFGKDREVKLIKADENGGYARGNNLGCEYFDTRAEVDKILILNDDTLFTADILSPMEAYLDGHPDCGVVYPMVYAPDGSIDPACLRRQKSVRDLVLQATSLGRLGLKRREFLDVEHADQAQVPPGSCMMLPKAVFRKIGWLDPGTFLYFEEHILTEKLRRISMRSALLRNLGIIHKGAQTTKKQPSKAVYRHWRNSYLYFMRNYSAVPHILQQLLRLRTWFKTL